LICVVQKFGGTSVATLERIKNVADIIARSYKKGQSVVAVVSAMAGVTNKFIGYVHNLNTYEGDPEYDQVVSSGEIITAGLLAISLKNCGLKARSYSSWQVPIITNSSYSNAVIQKIDSSNLKMDLSAGVIPVICGFQGVSYEQRVTTLGRGGSDLTAVAVAASVDADLCEIYSDVDGVYTVDPNLYAEAKRIDEISYREMLEMASHGAKILQEQSVNYAMQKGVAIRVASSFVDGSGTIISSKTSPKNFRGLAIVPSLSQIKVLHDENLSGIINILEERLIKTEIISQEGSSRVNILLDKKKTTLALNILKNCDFVRSARQIVAQKPFSQISVIGSFISSEAGKFLVKILEDKKIDIFKFSAAGYKVNLIIASDRLAEAIELLHKHCGL
jgi:aspartate kinase